jgi:hypothetical protein
MIRRIRLTAAVAGMWQLVEPAVLEWMWICKRMLPIAAAVGILEILIVAQGHQ